MGEVRGLARKRKDEAGVKKNLFPLSGRQGHDYSLIPLEIFGILSIYIGYLFIMNIVSNI